MTFLFPLLLAGLAVAAVPVLLHLLLHQRPRQLLFPAFRFLVPNYRVNKRQLRLKQWLLLALRVMLLAALCLALSRPKVFSERLSIGSDRPAAMVLLFDTSASMEYRSGGKTSLQIAQEKGLELLDKLSEGSRVAVLDTAEPGGAWAPTPSIAREQIESLRIKPANGPLTNRLAEAYRLFADHSEQGEDFQEDLPRFFYLFTDRTVASWDTGRQQELEALRQSQGKGVLTTLVDVGPERPVDVAVLAIDLPNKVLGTEERLRLRATVHAEGADCDTELICKIDNETTPERKPVRLQAGQSQVVTFERDRQAAGWHQADIRLATSDSLAANDVIYLTYEVHGGRRILLVVDDLRDAEFWKLALESTNAFQCDVRRPADVLRLPMKEWSSYRAVCLMNVAQPSAALWQLLEKFVKDGGGLAIMPGGAEMQPAAYAETFLMPAKLRTVVRAEGPDGARWNEESYRHPVLAAFREWRNQPSVGFVVPPAAERYWEVQPIPSTSFVIVSYADKSSRPALLERSFDPAVVRGRVLLFTTPMDRSHLDHALGKPWNNYLPSWFYLVLANKTMDYLAGDAADRLLNFRCGQPVLLPVPAASANASYLLRGPGLAPDQAVVRRADNKAEIVLTQPFVPGNYVLEGGDGAPVARFSVNLAPEESRWDKVPVEQIEAVLGPDTVLPALRGTSLSEALQKHRSQPLELFPGLMIFVLILLAFENLLSNRFYRKSGPAGVDTEAGKEAA